MKNVRETMLENKLGITDSTELARMEERTIKYGKIKIEYFIIKWIYCRYYGILIKLDL